MSSNQLHTTRAIQFALTLAQGDELVADPASLEAVTPQIASFIYGRRFDDGTVFRGHVYDQSKIRELQVAVRTLFTTLLATGQAAVHLKLDYVLVVDRFESGTSDQVHLIAGQGFEDPKDKFLYRLLRLLEEHDMASKLRRCPEPKCGRMFIKVTRKEYCSRQCQSRAWIRTQRAREREEARKTTRRRRDGKQTRTRRR